MTIKDILEIINNIDTDIAAYDHEQVTEEIIDDMVIRLMDYKKMLLGMSFIERR